MPERAPSPHTRYMQRCLELAQSAIETGDTPVGSLIVRDGEIVAEGIEAVRARGDVTAHAEIEAIRVASLRLGTRDLTRCTLYTSVEPCPMCAYAIRLARLSTVVTGARVADVDGPWAGCALLTDASILPNRTPPVLVRDVLADECQAVLMQNRRAEGS